MMLFVFLTTVNNLSNIQHAAIRPSTIRDSMIAIKEQWASMFIILCLAAVVYFAHKTELLWFAVACFAYLASASISRAVSGNVAYQFHGSLRLAYRLMLLALIS